MANTSGFNEQFIPTEQDKETVQRLKSFGVREDIIRTLITHPSTGEAISTETFGKAFKAELITAKIEGLKSAIHAFYDGMNSDDEEMRFKSANRFYQLCSKGLLEPKAHIQKTDSSQAKVDKIIEGLQEGTLNTYEADSMIKALEVRTKVELEDMQEKITKMVNKLAEKGIQII